MVPGPLMLRISVALWMSRVGSPGSSGEILPLPPTEPATWVKFTSCSALLVFCRSSLAIWVVG